MLTEISEHHAMTNKTMHTRLTEIETLLLAVPANVEGAKERLNNLQNDLLYEGISEDWGEPEEIPQPTR